MTERFNVSSNFPREWIRPITQAVKISDLSEGINVVTSLEGITAKPPFAVIVKQISIPQKILFNIYGAEKYVQFTRDVGELAERLTKDKQF